PAAGGPGRQRGQPGHGRAAREDRAGAAARAGGGALLGPPDLRVRGDRPGADRSPGRGLVGRAGRRGGLARARRAGPRAVRGAGRRAPPSSVGLTVTARTRGGASMARTGGPAREGAVTALGRLDLAVDRASPVPLYHQLAQQLEAAIERGRLAPGDLLGNEVDLSVRLGLSRPTVRQAIQSLVDKGLLVRRRGVGTQVVHSKVRRPLKLSSLYDDLEAAGQAPTTEVVRNEPVPASPEVAAALG